MPVAQAPRAVDTIVKAVSGDIRKFAQCLERAKTAQTSEHVDACLRQLDGARQALQQHRAELRQRVAALGAKGAGKEKLGAARTSIEQELRKLQDFEKKMEAARPTSPSHGVAEKRASSVESLPQTPVTASGAASSASDSGDEPGEVKVLQTQLLRGQADDEDVTKEFVCKICLDVVGCAPKLTRCAHLFCGDCIKQWFAVQPKSQTWAGRAKATGAVPCPVCKEPLNEQDDLHEVCPGQRGNSAFLWKMLSNLEVRCANHPACNPAGRCDWTGTYGDFQAHIQCCDNEPLRCEVALEAPEADAAPAQPMPLGQERPLAHESEAFVAAYEDPEAPEADAAPTQPVQLDQERPVAPTCEALDAAGADLEPPAEPEPATTQLAQPLPPPAAPASAASPPPPDAPVPQAAAKKTKQQKKAKAAAAGAPGAGGAAPATDPAALVAAAAQAAQLAAVAAQRQAYVQQVGQWQAAQVAQQMAYAARMQAVPEQCRAAYAAQSQMAYAAQCRAAYAAQYQAAYAARVQAAASLCGM